MFQRCQTLRQIGEFVLPSFTECWSYQSSKTFPFNSSWILVWSQGSLILSTVVLFLVRFTSKPLSEGVYLLLVLLPKYYSCLFYMNGQHKNVNDFKDGKSTTPLFNSSWFHFCLSLYSYVIYIDKIVLTLLFCVLFAPQHFPLGCCKVILMIL